MKTAYAMIVAAITAAGDNATKRTIAKTFIRLFPEEWETYEKGLARSLLVHEINRRRLKATDQLLLGI